eukprot:PhM_4_TR16274/c0_g1_i1/m.17999
MLSVVNSSAAGDDYVPQSTVGTEGDRMERFAALQRLRKECEEKNALFVLRMAVEDVVVDTQHENDEDGTTKNKTHSGPALRTFVGSAALSADGKARQAEHAKREREDENASAYRKGVRRLQATLAAKKGRGDDNNEIDLIAEEAKRSEKQRSKLHRHRVSYVDAEEGGTKLAPNDDNRRFNERLRREYSAYTDDIRRNIAQ